MCSQKIAVASFCSCVNVKSPLQSKSPTTLAPLLLLCPLFAANNSKRQSRNYTYCVFLSVYFPQRKVKHSRAPERHTFPSDHSLNDLPLTLFPSLAQPQHFERFKSKWLLQQQQLWDFSWLAQLNRKVLEAAGSSMRSGRGGAQMDLSAK